MCVYLCKWSVTMNSTTDYEGKVGFILCYIEPNGKTLYTTLEFLLKLTHQKLEWKVLELHSGLHPKCWSFILHAWDLICFCHFGEKGTSPLYAGDGTILLLYTLYFLKAPICRALCRNRCGLLWKGWNETQPSRTFLSPAELVAPCSLNKDIKADSDEVQWLSVCPPLTSTTTKKF